MIDDRVISTVSAIDASLSKFVHLRQNLVTCYALIDYLIKDGGLSEEESNLLLSYRIKFGGFIGKDVTPPRYDDVFFEGVSQLEGG